MLGLISTALIAGALLIVVVMRRRHIDGLERRVRERTHALDVSNEALQRSRDNERRFTGYAAHELRTPLAALRTHAQLAN